MRVSSIETLRIDEYPNIVYVRLHTDEGLIGLGETSFGPRAVETYIHESVAPYLLGANPLDIEQHWHALAGYVGFGSSGVENRGRSAIDLALWDLFGKSTGLPLYRLLGGPSRERIRAYNTCAGYNYIRKPAAAGGQATSAFGLEVQPEGPYEDLDAFLNRPVELAESLLAMGISAMKIWPLDRFAESTGGHGISNANLAAGIEPFAKIRDSLGDRMELMLEMHGLWDAPTAIRIARALEDYDLTWIEDPVRPNSLDALARVTQATTIPITASELLATRWEFRDLIDRSGISIVMFDPAWVGGVSESRRIIDLAQGAHLPVAVHDCLGPVEYVTAVHLSIHAPNALIQESVRAFWSGWYRELVTVVPEVVDGMLGAPDGPGLGTDLHPAVFDRPDVHRRVSDLDD